MTVKEFIKNKDNFIITRNGGILAIKNKGHKINFGKSATGTSFLNEEIRSTDITKGLYADLTGIRI